MARSSCPHSLAKQVSTLYWYELKANTREANDLWQRIATAEPNFAKKFLADSYSCTEQLHRLIARHAPSLVQRDRDGASKGNGKGNGKGKGALAKPNARAGSTKGSGKGGSKGGGKGLTASTLQMGPTLL